MNNIPRVRYPATWLAIAIMIVSFGNGGDLSATLSGIGTQAAAASAVLMALAKIAEEWGKTLDANDPMSDVSAQDLDGFWRRVL